MSQDAAFTPMLDAGSTLFSEYRIVSQTGAYAFSGTFGSTASLFHASILTYPAAPVPVELQRCVAE